MAAMAAATSESKVAHHVSNRSIDLESKPHLEKDWSGHMSRLVTKPETSDVRTHIRVRSMYPSTIALTAAIVRPPPLQTWPSLDLFTTQSAPSLVSQLGEAPSVSVATFEKHSKWKKSPKVDGQGSYTTTFFH